MAEPTTTDEVVEQPTGADEALPVESTETPAADDTNTDAEPSEPTEDAEEATEPTEQSASEPDEKLQKYAASQGLELDSPSAIKAARIAMKAQSEATRNHQKASELEKNFVSASDDIAEEAATNTGQDPEILKRLQRVEVRDAVRDFYDAHPEARQYDQVMGEIATARPHLRGDLEALYATAVVQTGGVAAVKSQGKREALESLAHNQQAAVPTGNATTSGQPKQKKFEDLSIPEMEKKLGFVKR